MTSRENFNDVEESLNDIRENFDDIRERLNDIRENFNDIGGGNDISRVYGR
jgi:archaellum component FlaC